MLVREVTGQTVKVHLELKIRCTRKRDHGMGYSIEAGVGVHLHFRKSQCESACLH
jgi:hypothetical protein